jgi:hypothetical protein
MTAVMVQELIGLRAAEPAMADPEQSIDGTRE